MKDAKSEFYIKCNKLFITELKRIRTRFEKNRVKELQALIEIDEEMEQTSELDIMDGYGCGAYDEEEYDRRMQAYRDYCDKKEVLKDMPTIQTQMIKIINRCINDTEIEIDYIKVQSMSEEEKKQYYKHQQELEERRQRRLKKRGDE